MTTRQRNILFLLLPVLGLVAWFARRNAQRRPVAPVSDGTHAEITAPLSPVLPPLSPAPTPTSDAEPVTLPRVGWLFYLRLPLIFVMVYAGLRAQALFELRDDAGFYWVALGGAMLALLMPRLPTPRTVYQASVGLASRPRVVLGVLLLLVGLSYHQRGYQQFMDVPIGGVATPDPWNQYLTGLGLWVAGVLIATRTVTRRMTPPAPGADTPTQNGGGKFPAAALPWVETALIGLALFGIIGLAAYLRLHDLDEYPFGIWFDEAMGALEARRMLQSPDYRPVFIHSINITGVHVRLYAEAMDIFGTESIYGPRIVSALFGILSVPAAFALGRQLHGAGFGLLMALLMAVMYWSVVFSRIAMTGIDVGVFTCLTAYFVIRLTRYGNLRDAMLVGLCLGGGLWFYSAFRFVAVGLAVLGLLGWLWWNRGNWMILVGGGAMIAITGLLVLYPLLTYVHNEPDNFYSRARMVTLGRETNLEPGYTLEETLQENLRRHARMFHISGDRNGRHNVPGSPMLPPFMGLLFGFGVVVVFLQGWRRAETWAFAALFMAGMIGGVITVMFEAPQALRSIGVLPVIAYCGAWSLYAGGRLIERALSPWPQLTPLRYLVLGVAGVGVAVALTRPTYEHYFETHRYDYRSWLVFSTEYSIIGYIGRDLPPQVRVYGTQYILAAESSRIPWPEANERMRLLPTNDTLPLRIAPDAPALLFFDPTQLELVSYARQLYPNARFDVVQPQDYGIPAPEYVVLFYTLYLTPQDIASIQGGQVVDEGFEAVLYAPLSGVYAFSLPEAGVLMLNDIPYPLEAGQEVQVDLPTGNHRLRIEPPPTFIYWRTPDSPMLEPLSDTFLYDDVVRTSGLTASLYPNANWEGEPDHRRIDDNLDWRIHILPLSRPYSVRWEGQFIPPQAGEYRLQLEARSTGEIWLDGQRILQAAGANAPQEIRIMLEARPYAIEAQFQDMDQHSYFELRWLLPGMNGDFLPIPTEYFRPSPH